MLDGNTIHPLRGIPSPALTVCKTEFDKLFHLFAPSLDLSGFFFNYLQIIESKSEKNKEDQTSF